MNMYEQFQNAGCQIEHWQSDMYVKKDSKSEEIVDKVRKERTINIGLFLDNHGVVWYDIPFGYIPYWENKEGK